MIKWLNWNPLEKKVHTMSLWLEQGENFHESTKSCQATKNSSSLKIWNFEHV